MALKSGDLLKLLTGDIWNVDLEAVSAPRAFLIKTLRLVTVSVRDFSEGLINLRAMSLVYTTLLSLVPLLAVSFSVLKGFGVHNQMEPLLANFLAPLGPKGEEITATIIGFVENLNVTVLGSIGLAILIYTAISLIQKVEEAFNEIWRIRRQRSLARRFSDYMSILVIGPVLIFSGLGLTASFMGTTVVKKIVAIEPLGTAFLLAGKFLPFLVACAAFSFIYIFVPSTAVRIRSAMAGGLFAAVLWQAAGLGFASFIVSSTKYATIYSGFAIVILFMIWIYLSWLILLFGAKVAFYHQYPNFLLVRKEAFLLDNRLEEKLSLVVMGLIGRSHYRNEPRWDLGSLLERLKLPLEPVQEVLGRLERKGLIIVGCGDTQSYLPAHDIETIPLAEVIGAVRSPGNDSTQFGERYLSVTGVDEIAGEIDEAMSKVLKGKTVKDLVLSMEKGGGSLGRVTDFSRQGGNNDQGEQQREV